MLHFFLYCVLLSATDSRLGQGSYQIQVKAIQLAPRQRHKWLKCLVHCAGHSNDQLSSYINYHRKYDSEFPPFCCKSISFLLFCPNSNEIRMTHAILSLIGINVPDVCFPPKISLVLFFQAFASMNHFTALFRICFTGKS